MHPITCSWVRYPEEKTLFVEHKTLKLGSVMRWRDTIALLLFGWGSASSPGGAVLVISTPQASIYFEAFWLCQGFHPSLDSEMKKKTVLKIFGKSSSNFRINYLGLLT